MTVTIQRALPALFLFVLTAASVVAQGQGRPRPVDIENIGNRDINGGSLNFTSIEIEIAFGRQLAAEIDRQVKLVNDPKIGEFVNRIGQNLVRNSDSDVPFNIKVVDSAEVNAFSLPGGFVYVNTGVILAAADDAELASVIAHQIARIAARHATEMAARTGIANSVSLPLPVTLAGLGVSSFAYKPEAANLVPTALLEFLRQDVAEADYLGVQYLYKTGYDPRAAVRFLERLNALELASPDQKLVVPVTHPRTAERIEAMQREIDMVLPVRSRNIVTTPEFESIKRQVAEASRPR